MVIQCLTVLTADSFKTAPYHLYKLFNYEIIYLIMLIYYRR